MILGIVGYAGSGKDAFASRLVEEHGFTKIAFADPVREMVEIIDPIIYFVGGQPRRYTEVIETLGYNEAKRIPEVRRILQVVGTEAGREFIDPDIWVDIWERSVYYGPQYKQPNPVVATDVRFDNEVKRIREMGGYIVLIERDGVEAPNDHSSELLPSYVNADFIVENNGTLDDLYDSADTVLKTLHEGARLQLRPQNAYGPIGSGPWRGV